MSDVGFTFFIRGRRNLVQKQTEKNLVFLLAPLNTQRDLDMYFGRFGYQTLDEEQCLVIGNTKGTM